MTWFPPSPSPSPPRSTVLDGIADSIVVRTGVAPAVTLAVAARSASSWQVAVGSAGHLDGARTTPTQPDTPFDLASITKPFVATAATRLARRGKLDLAAPIEEYLPELGAQETGRVAVELLLSHRAGLMAHIELFHSLVAGRSIHPGEALRSAAAARRPECDGVVPAAGFPPTYSDLGYLLIGAALERVTGDDLDRVVATEVSTPLGLAIGSARDWMRARGGCLGHIAPTEHVPWRGGTIRGAVHDENAWALAGHGLAGHAGLFGTATAVAEFGAALIDALNGRSAWLEASSAAHLVEPRPGSSLLMGFDGRSPGASSAGTCASPRTFGHLGFTGTSFWCDPDARIVTVLLTNRVCPSRGNLGIRKARPLVHDALYVHATGCVPLGADP
ncbi:MAG: beta-lactamase family protein [Polyangiaceae bacterium]|nr:beta-lactamase family protein [Polyangiaceae bacterium]